MSDDKAVVKVGDRFLRVDDSHDMVRAGWVGEVSPLRQGHFDQSEPDALVLNGDDGVSVIVEVAYAAKSHLWRRVPPGYTVPPVADILASMVRVVDAYKGMLADPETGAAGIDATVREMARLGGIEVTW